MTEQESGKPLEPKSAPEQQPLAALVDLKISPQLPGVVIQVHGNAESTQAYLSVHEIMEDVSCDEIETRVRDFLRNAVVKGHIDRFWNEEFPALIRKRKPFSQRLFAETSSPTEPVDTRIVHLVPRPTREFLIRPNGTCDFRNRDLFRSVSDGDGILVRYPPQPGEPGMTIMGTQILPRPPKQVQVLAGKNVAVVDQEDGSQLYKATSTGQVVVENRGLNFAVQVVPVLEIKSNVDYGCGNINFKGCVNIHGSVLSGFSVTATGNVTVCGMIEPKARVTAGGDLHVHKGILGNGTTDESTKVKAFGNVQALYAENAFIEAGGDVLLRSAMRCTINANGGLFVEKVLVGGQISTFKSIEAAEIGNPTAMSTIIHCGSSPEALHRLNLLTRIIQDLRKQKDKVDTNLRFVVTQGEDLPDDKRGPLQASLEKKAASLQDQIDRIEIKKADLAMNLLDETASTISAQTLFPGVVLVIRSAKYVVEREMTSLTFYQKLPDEFLQFKTYQPAKSAKASKGGPGSSKDED
ncbi:MAG TPA: FapA family protein [Candidatus Ozemobacteraceae bacterium]|nr:FapA family protein [Candidatus Ozemobacteraceae bacterium]